jgi:LysM repeat protein
MSSQGMRYGIAAGGTLMLLTILSWNADEANQKKREQSARQTIEGTTVTARPQAPANTASAPLTPTPGEAPFENPEIEGLGDFDGGSKSAEPLAASGAMIQPPSTTVNLGPALSTSPPAAAAAALGADKEGGSKTALAPPATTAPEASSNILKNYKVQSGESLYAIAKNTLGNGNRWKEILAANPALKTPEDLRAGMNLTIPSSAPLALARPAPAASTPSPNGDEGDDHESPAGKTYTVQAGDTLSSIAASQLGSKKHWKKIFDANRSLLPSPDHVREGQRLLLPQ